MVGCDLARRVGVDVIADRRDPIAAIRVMPKGIRGDLRFELVLVLARSAGFSEGMTLLFARSVPA